MKFYLNVKDPLSAVVEVAKMRKRTKKGYIPPTNPITMFDSVHSCILPWNTDKKCWNCRKTFTSRPLGCPIMYHMSSTKVAEFFKESNIVSTSTDYYETEGLFCSTPCIASYIDDRAHISRYKDSLTFLRAMTRDMTSSDIVPQSQELERAVPFFHTVEYGGQLKDVSTVPLENFNNERRPYMFVTRLQGAFRE